MLHRLVALFALTSLPAAAQSAAGSNEGGLEGGVLLIGLLIWLASSARKDELVRCPVCRLRQPRRKFSAGTCPRCGTHEDIFR
jgi:hypothetical protein